MISNEQFPLTVAKIEAVHPITTLDFSKDFELRI
jgi:hypothetical protein